MRKEAPSPRLVVRFAVGSLVAFVLVGAGVGAILVRYVRIQAEERGSFHARFIADAVLPLAFDGVDLSQPLRNDDLARVDAFVRTRILSDGRDVRVKVWRPNATIVYSDEPRLIGRRFEEERADIREAMSGDAEAGVSDLDDPENQFERNLADKLFFTYVPLRLTPHGPVVAVAEVYQDYSVLQGDIDGLLRTLGLTLGVGLLLLYAALLPIVVRAARDIRRQNDRLNELLDREHANVEQLRAAGRKKDDFVAAVSHELRTPLTSIIGYLATLRQPAFADDPDARAEFLSAAEAQAKRLLRLITNVLTAAELDERARPIVLERIDLTQMTSEIAADIAGGRGRIDVSIDPDATFVVSDRTRLAEILTNLVDNALKYSHGDDHVDVAASCTESGGIVISVRDRGIGIPPEDRGSLFDRFSQGDQSSTRRYGGLGLGLHLVRSMVDDLGGSIDVRDAEGAGTVFVVTLPALEPEGAMSGVSAIAASGARPAP